MRLVDAVVLAFNAYLDDRYDRSTLFTKTQDVVRACSPKMQRQLAYEFQWLSDACRAVWRECKHEDVDTPYREKEVCKRCGAERMLVVNREEEMHSMGWGGRQWGEWQ